MTTGKTIALTRWTFVDKVMSLLFNILVGHHFPSKEEASFHFMATVTICSDFGAPQNKVKRKKKRKQWYIYIMEYYSAIKKNTFESVLMRWMNLEPTIQSEVSQKEKHQYRILTHIYGI